VCSVQRAACSDAARKDKRTERQVPTGQEGGTSPESVVLEPAPLQLRVASPAPAARRATPSDPPHAQGGPAAVVAATAATALVAVVAAVAAAAATAAYSSAECLLPTHPPAYPCPTPAALRQLVKRTLPPGSSPRPPGPVSSRLQPCTPISSGVQASHGHTWRQGARAGLCSNRPGHHQHWARFRPNPMAMGSDLTRPDPIINTSHGPAYTIGSVLSTYFLR
jgi:hypothetical protein